MAQHSLTGVTLKLSRAQEHLYAIDEAIREFLSTPDAYDLVLDHNDRNRPKLVVIGVHTPPPQLGVLIGECAYNLRSALDQLAFQLAIAHHGRRRVPADIERRSAFPIFKSGPKFRARNRAGKPARGSGLSCIWGMSTTAQAIVERTQPYHRKRNPQARVLWQLHELCNLDKHRTLPLTIAALAGSNWRLTSETPIILHSAESYPGPFKRDAVIARWHLTPAAGPLKLQMETELVTDVVFSKESGTPPSIQGQSVMRTLQTIVEFVAAEVLPPLAADMGLTTTFRAGRLLDVMAGEVPGGP